MTTTETINIASVRRLVERINQHAERYLAMMEEMTSEDKGTGMGYVRSSGTGKGALDMVRFDAQYAVKLLAELDV